MNASKNSNGWILCPSKTFPGKFYYFNVLNGETAWGLGDSEKKLLKEDGDITKITPSHHHELSSPPISDSRVTNSFTLTQPKFSVIQHPAPEFGQSVFPKSLPSKTEEPNVIWTPIQIQVPIVIPPKSVQLNQQSQVLGKEKILSAVSVKSSLDIGKELYTHTCTQPLSQRFVNYDKTVISFDKDNKIKDQRQFEKYYTSTPIKSFNKMVMPTFKTIASNANQIFQLKNNISFSDLKPKITGQKQLIKESIFNIELPSKTPEKVLQTSEIDIEPKDDSNKTGIAIASPGQVVNKGDDLRNLLRAKKRKTLDFNVKSNSGEIDSKRSKTSAQDSKPKKKVSFNLNIDNIPRIEYEDENHVNYAATVQILKDLAGPGSRSEEWRLVVDAEMLLQEFSFLESLIKIDPNCRLVIPSPTICEVAAVSKGDCCDRTRVLQARNIIRKLNNNQIIVQSADGTELKSSSNDAILETCVEALDQNIHVILITNNQELLTTAKCYPIHCYKIEDIKNGLASIPKASGYKQMKITIRNDTEPNFTPNGLALHGEQSGEDLNEKEKSIIRKFKQTVVDSNDRKNISDDTAAIVKPMIPKWKMPNVISRISNTSLVSNDCSGISKRNSIISDINAPFICTKSNMDGISTNIEENFKIPDLNSTKVNTNSGISKENSTIYNTKALTTEWRCAASDITETTIDVDMKNLNLKEKPFESTATLCLENKKSNETVSFYFQKPIPKFGFQKFKSKHTGREQSIFYEKQKHPECSKFELNTLKPIFEANEEEPLNTVFEIGKEKNARSKFDDVFKKPQIVQPNEMSRTNLDLSGFDVKSKIMENRLKEKMDEWLCTYKQIMEESLSSVLEKLSPSVLRSMIPPWSLYEALICTKNIYKQHILIKYITEEISKCLYEGNCKTDRMKKYINPSEFMKATGYGMHLIKYLKNIFQNSEELSEAEVRLSNMIKHIENPDSDIDEPLVKTPAVTNPDVKEIRQNFVKNRSEIIKYLKKHYPEWRSYEDKTEESKFKIVRTCGRNLNLLRLEKRNTNNNNKKVQPVDDVIKNFEVTTVNVGNVATKNVSNVTTQVIENNTTKNVNNETNIVSNVITKNIGNNVTNNEFATNRTALGTSKIISNFMNTDTDNKRTLQSTKTDKEKINRITSKYFEKCNITKPKPKSKGIFEFINPKDTKCFDLVNQESINKEYKVTNKLKMDSNMLGVKITIPNNYNGQTTNLIDNEGKATHKISETQKYTKDTKDASKVSNHKQMEVQKYNEKFNENNANKNNVTKIIRNINIIDDYEKRFENRKLNEYIEELDYSLTCSIDESEFCNSNDITNNDVPTNNAAKEYDLNDHLDKCNDNFTKEYELDDHVHKSNDINNIVTNENSNGYRNSTDNDLKDHSTRNNKASTQTDHYLNDKDFKNDTANDRKNDKDDMTNDSGFGNESPHVYSVVKSFSSELTCSVDVIQTYIDGSLQEFRDGKLNGKTKMMFRLKALEANFMITKIIIKLNKLVLKETNGQNGVENNISRNAEVVSKCAEKAKLLQKTLNTILTLTNEDGSAAEINSSLSLNMST